MIQGLHLSHVAILVHLTLMMLEGERPVKADYKRLARLLYSKAATIESAVEQLLADGKLTKNDDGFWSDMAEKEMQFRRQKSDKARINVGKRIEKDQRKQRRDKSTDDLVRGNVDVEAEREDPKGLHAVTPRSTSNHVAPLSSKGSANGSARASLADPSSEEEIIQPSAPIDDDYEVENRMPDYDDQWDWDDEVPA